MHTLPVLAHDLISIDALARKLTLGIPNSKIKARLAKYAKLVNTASEGAVTDVELGAESMIRLPWSMRGGSPPGGIQNVEGCYLQKEWNLQRGPDCGRDKVPQF